MKFATTLRTPFHSRTIVRSEAAGQVPDTGLRRAIVATRTVLAILCAARAATDWLHGHATLEGGVALALVGAFTTWLAAEAIGGEVRASVSAQGDTPYRSSCARATDCEMAAQADGGTRSLAPRRRSR